MCGICYKSNIYSTTDYKKFISSCEKMNHRGPDDFGYIFNKNHSLGHKRLSIIDPKNARQPMSYLNSHLVYNGELYNYDELIEYLGEELEFKSDTLLLLKLLNKYGVSVLRKLNGIFSFVYIKDDEVYIVRDMFGVKPLYHTMMDKDIMVASELKVILSYNEKAVVSKEGLCELLAMGPSHSIGKTIYKDIHELKPGHYLSFKNGKVVEHEYFELIPKKFDLTYEQTVKQVRKLLDKAIKNQMVSDVGISCLLSGGLDSSIIASSLALNKSDLDTYCIDYEDNKENFKANDFEITEDRDYAKMVASSINSNFNLVTIRNEDLVKGLEETVLLRDSPGMTDIDSSMYYLSKVIAKEHKVSMSGECSDEIFGGYPWYYKKDIISGFPWIRNIEYRESLLNNKWKNKLKIKEYLINEYNMACGLVKSLDSDTDEQKKHRQLFILNLKYFMTNLLDRKDRMTMGASLEVRVPFCDKDLVNFLYNVPFEYKYKDKIEKKLLRDAYSDIVIDSVINRKKSPYPKSYSNKYHIEVVKILNKALEDKNSILYELFDVEAIKDLIKNDVELEVPWYGQLMRKTALLAYLYQIHFWAKQYNIIIEE